MIRIRIPATSANVGAGFDSLGLAVSLCNEIYAEPFDEIRVESLDGAQIPQDENNLVVRSILRLYEKLGRPFAGVRLGQVSAIPLARGLGSSSACIVGGLLAGNALCGEPLGRGELLDMAAEMEGHPDNVAPAFLGGFVTSVYADGHVHCLRRDIGDDLRFVVAVPDYKLSTVLARSVLPEQVSRADCVYNLSRAALMSAAMHTRDYTFLRAAAGDRLHQPYRLPLMPGGEAMLRRMESEGAYCSTVSGAGPSVLAMVPAADTGFADRVRALSAGDEAGWEILSLAPDNTGAVRLE